MISTPDGLQPSGAAGTGVATTSVSADVLAPTPLIRGRFGRLLIQLRRPLIVLLHVGLIVGANYSAFWLRFDGEIPDAEFRIMINVLPALIGIRAMTFLPLKLYEGLWRYAGLWDLRNIVVGVGASSLALFLLVHGAFGIGKYPRSVVVIDSIILVSLMGGARLGRRVHRELSYVEREKRVLIFGAGDAGEMIVRDMKTNPDYDYEPVGFIDDDPRKSGSRIHGVPVLGGRDQLPHIIRSQRPQEVIVALPGTKATTIREVVRLFEPYKISIKMVPNLPEIMGGRLLVSQIRNLKIEDLLAREPIGLDPSPLERLVKGKRVLVTGAGGSIGSELCRQIAQFEPEALALYERYENGLFNIVNDLADRQARCEVLAIIGDVTDRQRLDSALRESRPSIIFHAAAHKHVPLMEFNPCEAVKNNIFGTRAAMAAAESHGVDRFVLISTDKAVNPSSVMGATKRVAELMVQSMNQRSSTTFLAVRFGNVLASNGSVVPRFVDQIKAGGPVTVTHREMRRYFMLIPEAVQLVLHAAALAEPGAIYVLEMGEQVNLVDMARNLIRLSGFIPDEEIRIVFTGLRPGEKLFEELVGDDESAEPSSIDKIRRVRPLTPLSPEQLALELAMLEGLSSAGDVGATLLQLSRIVPAFRPEGLFEAVGP